MPWDYILGSAGGAGIALVLGLIAAQKILERTIDNRFDLQMEKWRAENERRSEFNRSDLGVWDDLRKEILAEMWKTHRSLVKAMTAVILKAQEAEQKDNPDLIKPALEAYRNAVHENIDLLSPEAVEICQDFLQKAYMFMDGNEPINDANSLKAQRREFYGHVAEYYGLEKMMPWMAKKGVNDG